MERWQNRVAVVTGASSGIGEACAKHLVQAGLRVVALARREHRMIENHSKLSKEHQARYFVHKCDISVEDEVKDTFSWIEKNLGGTDILVNNAGCLHDGNLLEMDSTLINEILNVNLNGVIYCSREAFKSMKNRNVDGHLVHINSVAGQTVVPLGEGAPSFNAYNISKFGVTAFNEVIRQELNNYHLNIKTTNIYPGLVKTDILPPERFALISKALLSSDDVAETVIYAISTPPRVLIKELTVKAMGEWF